MHGYSKTGRTYIVSFSGIDGSGKTTQIETLSAYLAEAGLRVELIRFWDDVARFKGIRETSGHRIFKGDKGVGTPQAPIHRRDKNVQSGFMTCVRLFLYFADAISTRLAVKRALRSRFNVVIFDRYTVDEWANLNLRNPLIRTYIRLLTIFVPRPDVGFLLDAEPVKARARKPEYPLEFLERNRQAYLTLVDMIGGISVITPMAIAEVEKEVIAQTARKLSHGVSRHPGSSGWHELDDSTTTGSVVG